MTCYFGLSSNSAFPVHWRCINIQWRRHLFWVGETSIQFCQEWALFLTNVCKMYSLAVCWPHTGVNGRPSLTLGDQCPLAPSGVAVDTPLFPSLLSVLSTTNVNSRFHGLSVAKRRRRWEQECGLKTVVRVSKPKVRCGSFCFSFSPLRFSDSFLFSVILVPCLHHSHCEIFFGKSDSSSLFTFQFHLPIVVSVRARLNWQVSASFRVQSL